MPAEAALVIASCLRKRIDMAAAHEEGLATGCRRRVGMMAKVDEGKTLKT